MPTRLNLQSGTHCSPGSGEAYFIGRGAFLRLGAGQGRHPQAGVLKIDILGEARNDLIAGYRFYEKQAPGLGSYLPSERSQRETVNGRRLERT